MSTNVAATENTQQRTPSEFLLQAIGRPVVVKLNSNVEYRGK